MCKNLGTFIRVIFAAVKNGKQPKCPTGRDWLNKLRPIQVMPDNKTQRGHQRGKDVQLHSSTWKGIHNILNYEASHETVWHVLSFLFLFI